MKCSQKEGKKRHILTYAAENMEQWSYGKETKERTGTDADASVATTK